MGQNRSDDERVVITGIGAVTPLGLNVAESWEGMVNGRSGVDYITGFDTSDLPVKIAALIKQFDPTVRLPAKAARRMARSSQLAIHAGYEAIEDAGLSISAENSDRIGVLIGTAYGGFDEAASGVVTVYTEGYKKLSPFVLAASLPNIPAHYLSYHLETTGYISTIATACAAGNQAIGEAVEVIRQGAADVMITGGVESNICPSVIAGFFAMRALSTMNSNPQTASRPFDATRDGLVLGEGAAIFVLESLATARARGAKVYAEIVGHASSSDSYHVAQPDPDGKGAGKAMIWALENAGLMPEDIDYINAHATGTPLGDVAETMAIKRVFKDHAYKVPISSTKSMVGHGFGAGGAVEAVACVMSIQHNVIHPTINLHEPDPQCDLDYVPNEARAVEVRYALNNSFGFGGQNACLILGRVE